MKKDKDFERLVERVYRLLEPDDSVVKWNEKIPDPDNPSQLRQIDIVIKSPGYTTYIECRIHAKPQNVKWIEGLIGQKASLNLDRVVAVSANGFTRGAIKKAARFGIEVRMLEALSDQDVLDWKAPSICKLLFYNVKKLDLNYHVNIKSATTISDQELMVRIQKLQIHNDVLNYFFHGLLDNRFKVDNFLDIKFRFHLNRWIETNIVITYVTIDASIGQFWKTLNLSSAHHFVQDVNLAGFATIENFENGIEIIKSEVKSSLYFSFGRMRLPDNVVFSGNVIVGFGERKTLGMISFEDSENDTCIPILSVKFTRN